MTTPQNSKKNLDDEKKQDLLAKYNAKSKFASKTRSTEEEVPPPDQRIHFDFEPLNESCGVLIGTYTFYRDDNKDVEMFLCGARQSLEKVTDLRSKGISVYSLTIAENKTKINYAARFVLAVGEAYGQGEGKELIMKITPLVLMPAGLIVPGNEASIGTLTERAAGLKRGVSQMSFASKEEALQFYRSHAEQAKKVQ